ncbi:DNA polymerase III subunit delta [Sulfurimonas autotrophica]|uniref:DNA polymerase III delta n=1 Tax=Sulfurimonas autotrophica (strain ATCC BAA-671 / DSM 16294 / JCM 11897 / OK10) TaxID=563040 RepID=E0UV69_SULAO|nr:DNA polymerase III subunit delta [Sulfurimonas autotrophica]ADN09651.1 DNA polymerase III delta [Sulfurimonas autotrophica DSM 16294]
MYKNEFDKHIQNKSISNSFVFFGESSFLIDMYTKMLTNIENTNILSYYHDEYDFNSAKAHLSQGSLFGDRNILIIKSEKKVPKKELDILLELCDKNPDNIFVYAYYGSDHKTYNNKKAFAKTKAMNVRFFHPKEYEAQNIVFQLAQEKNVNIDKFTISHLLKIHNGDVALASNEIDKFRVYDKAITTKDVDNLVYGLASINLDDFIKKLLDKKDFRDDLLNILEHGEDEIRIISAITAYLTQLYMFNIYIRINGAPNALEILGYPAPSFIVEQKASAAIKIKPQTYSKLHELLLNSELQMKSSNVDKSAILLSSLIRLQKLL